MLLINNPESGKKNLEILKHGVNNFKTLAAPMIK